MLENKTVLVTGSTGGLGLAVAAALAEAGAQIVLNGLESQSDGDQAAASLTRASGVPAIYVGADLGHLPEIARLVSEANARFGGVDILVNNAVVRHFSGIDALSPEAWNQSVAVNLSAAFHLMQLTVPHMRERKWGRILNMSSIYGARGAENRIDYVTTKTALIGMTRAAAIELARTGITCNALSPGTVPSPAITSRIAAVAAERGQSIEITEADYLQTRNPTGRFVSMEAVGALAAFVCGPHGDDITGTVLPIDGGWQAG